MSRADRKKAKKAPAIKDQLDLFAVPSRLLTPSKTELNQTAQRRTTTVPPVLSDDVEMDRRLIAFVTEDHRGPGRPPKSLHAAKQRLDDAKRLLDVREAASRLGLSKSTLDKMRCSGRGPRFIRATDRAVRYDPADLEAFADERRRRSTSDLDGLIAT